MKASESEVTPGRTSALARDMHHRNDHASGAGRSRGGHVSRGKKFVALSLMTFIVLIVLGAMWGHHSPG